MTEPRARSIVTEVVVIVGSILLAFALDAWWDERQEQARVGVLLDAVAVEFEAEVSVLDSILARNASRIDQMVRLVERSDPALPRLSEDSIALLVDGHPGAEAYDPGYGALTALIASGGLQSVESVELQRSLAGWTAEIVDLDWELAQLYDATARMLDRTVEIGRSSRHLLSPSRQHVYLRQVFDDPVTREAVAEIALAHGRYLSDLERIRDRAAAIALQIRSR